MTDVTTVIDDYIAIWNEGDAERRRQLVGTHLERGRELRRPAHVRARARTSIDVMIAAAQEQFPGHRFELVDGPDAHHDRVRFTWQLVAEAGGAPVAVGLDFGTLAADGRLAPVTGFLSAAA